MPQEKRATQDRVSQVFAEAIGKDSVEELEAYLLEACGGDAPLRARVERLLRSSEMAGDFLSRTPHGESLELGGDNTGIQIGPYHLVHKLGEGGFGVVYRALQSEPLRREVALKIIKLGMDTREVIARFQVERQALALMQHPNIAQVFDAGATQTGRPYFVMELAEGCPITEYCRPARLSTIDRLRLFMQVCDAVQHAHRRGIVHRDLKPSNVIVTLLDGKPIPKIIDFGIAKTMQEGNPDRTMLTRREFFLGTPAYMSPEQVRLGAMEVDQRSDIYSLGVLLYELLTGQPPFPCESFRDRAIEEVRRIIREEEPPKPSTRIQAAGLGSAGAAQHPSNDPLFLQRELKGDLDWIIMKALDKDRARRYQTAGELGADLLRHLQNEPVLAGPPKLGYRLQKFARRRRAALLTTAAASAVILLAAAFGWSQWSRTRKAEAQAVMRETRLQSVVAATGNLSLEPEALALVPGVLNVTPEAELSPDESLLAFVNHGGTDGDLHVRDLRTGESRNLTLAEKHAPGIFEFCHDVHIWSPDSRRLAYLWRQAPQLLEGELRIVSIATGEISVLCPGNPDEEYEPEDWSADRRFLLCLRRDRRDNRRSMVLIEVASGEKREIASVHPLHARLSRDGRYVAMEIKESPKDGQGQARSDIHVLDIETGKLERLTSHGHATRPIWSAKEPVVLFSSDRLGSWDLWGIRVEHGKPAAEPFLVRYGIGNFDKRLTQAGKLVVYRPVRPGDGYTIKEGLPLADPPVLEPFPGEIYLQLGRRTVVVSGQSGKAVIQPTRLAGVPSREPHAGKRWFLQTREVKGATANGNPRRELFAVAADGDQEILVQLTDNPLLQPGRPRWLTGAGGKLPDRRIAWSATASGPLSEQPPSHEEVTFYSAPLAFDAAGAIRGLAEPPVILAKNLSYHSELSPDGTRVASVIGFNLVNPSTSMVHVLEISTGKSRPLTQGRSPSWAPDSSRVAFLRGYDSVFTIRPDGPDLQLVASRLPSRSYPSIKLSTTPPFVQLRGSELRPGVRETLPYSGFQQVAWAPDCLRLIYTYRAVGEFQEKAFLTSSTGGEPYDLTRDVLESASIVAWVGGPERHNTLEPAKK